MPEPRPLSRAIESEEAELRDGTPADRSVVRARLTIRELIKTSATLSEDHAHARGTWRICSDL